jgi:N-acylneuraminate cytidylyltransferase
VSIVAIIPARGGSKRVPRKNLFLLEGRPLVAHSVRHALDATSVDEVIVSTDDDDIAAAAEAAGARGIRRPAELAGDMATSESALEHALAQLDAEPELVVFLQCTSPVRSGADIDAAVATLRAERADSLFSACPDRGLLWTLEPAGPRPLNYDPRRRLRDQDMAPQVRENGSIYIFRPAVLREHGSRLGGRIAVHEMDVWSSVQIDDPHDVELVAWILAGRRRLPGWPDRIELVVFDFDGVMTDNKVLVFEDGAEAVRADRGDGLGIARLRATGLPMWVLSTETHPVVAARCRKLGLPVRQGLADKGAALRALLEETGADPARTVYVGNDANDLECLQLVGMPVVPADAHPSVRDVAAHVLEHRGGDGAVRELCDLLLERL